MNRRSFFKSFAKAAVGVAVATHVPVSWLPEKVVRTGYLEILRAAFNKQFTSFDDPITTIYLGTKLFDAAKDELAELERFIYIDRVDIVVVPDPPFYFKGVKCYKSSYVKGGDWSFLFIKGKSKSGYLDTTLNGES